MPLCRNGLRRIRQLGRVLLGCSSNLSSPPSRKCARSSRVFTRIRCRRVLIRLNRSFQNFFRRVKKNEDTRVPEIQRAQPFQQSGIHAHGIPGARPTMWLSPRLATSRLRCTVGCRRKHGTLFLKQVCGSWYACFSCTVAPQVFPQSTQEIGVDVGLDSFAVLSDGTPIENPRWYRKRRKQNYAEHSVVLLDVGKDRSVAAKQSPC